MNNLPLISLPRDLAWIGEGPTLQHWHPEESWCDGFIFRTPQDYADAMIEVANELWRGLDYLLSPVVFDCMRDTQCRTTDWLAKEFGE